MIVLALLATTTSKDDPTQCLCPRCLLPPRPRAASQQNLCRMPHTARPKSGWRPVISCRRAIRHPDHIPFQAGSYSQKGLDPSRRPAGRVLSLRVPRTSEACRTRLDRPHRSELYLSSEHWQFNLFRNKQNPRSSKQPKRARSSTSIHKALCYTTNQPCVQSQSSKAGVCSEGSQTGAAVKLAQQCTKNGSCVSPLPGLLADRSLYSQGDCF
jgi:hypothetical protein